MGLNQSHKVMIVDDSRQSQPILKSIFNMWGIATVMAANGLEALQLLKGMRTLPEVIILDHHMPAMDGSQFCEALAAIQQFSSIPVLLISGDPNPPQTVDQVKPYRFFEKPVDFLELKECVQEILRHSSF